MNDTAAKPSPGGRRIPLRVALLVAGALLLAASVGTVIWTENENTADTPVPVIVATALWSDATDENLQSVLRFTFHDGSNGVAPTLTIANATPGDVRPSFVLLSHVATCQTGATNAQPLTGHAVDPTTKIVTTVTNDPSWPETVVPAEVGTVMLYASPALPMTCSLDRTVPLATAFESRRIRFYRKIDYAEPWFTPFAGSAAASYHVSGVDRYILEQADAENVRIDLRFGDLQTSKPAYQFVQNAPTGSDQRQWQSSAELLDTISGADFEWTEDRLAKRQEFILFLAAGVLGLALTLIFEALRSAPRAEA